MTVAHFYTVKKIDKNTQKIHKKVLSIWSVFHQWFSVCCYIAYHAVLLLQAWRPSICLSAILVACDHVEQQKTHLRIGRSLSYRHVEAELDHSILQYQTLPRKASGIQWFTCHTISATAEFSCLWLQWKHNIKMTR